MTERETKMGVGRQVQMAKQLVLVRRTKPCRVQRWAFQRDGREGTKA